MSKNNQKHHLYCKIPINTTKIISRRVQTISCHMEREYLFNCLNMCRLDKSPFFFVRLTNIWSPNPVLCSVSVKYLSLFNIKLWIKLIFTKNLSCFYFENLTYLHVIKYLTVSSNWWVHDKILQTHNVHFDRSTQTKLSINLTATCLLPRNGQNFKCFV